MGLGRPNPGTFRLSNGPGFPDFGILVSGDSFPTGRQHSPLDYVAPIH